jgi:hypothetical protein
MLDARSDDDPNRVVFDVFAPVEPYVRELDYWCSLPLRLVHTTGGGWGIELGPYELDAADILQLRKALAAYDEATRGRRCTCSPDPRMGE